MGKNINTEWAVTAFDTRNNTQLVEPVADEITARWIVEWRAKNGSTWARGSRVVKRTVTPWEEA